MVEQPDGVYATQYFDETGQPLSRVVTNSDPSGSPTKTWVTEVTRNSDGPGSPPSRSDTELRTTTVYDDDGTVLETEDPKGLKTRFTYDKLGRQTAVIANYVNGTPSGANGDDDVFTRSVYTSGLKTKYWVDLDGDNVEDGTDQVTVYTWAARAAPTSTRSRTP